MIFKTVPSFNPFFMQAQADNVKDKNLQEKTADLADHVEDLATTFYRLSVANLAQKTSNITSGVIVAVIMGVVSFFVLLFLSIALALWLGDMIESRIGGFLLGAAFFVILLLMVGLLRKQITSPIRNFIIRKIYD
jgi:hypothetical protein